MNRAENIYEFRRALFHGQKTGAHADPDYHEKYHPGAGGSTSKSAHGLTDGKHRIRVESIINSDDDPNIARLNDDFPPKWVEIYVNPTERQMKRLGQVRDDDGWPIEVRFMVDQESGDLIAWDSSLAVHTQVTRALVDKPAWAATEFHVYGGFLVPAENLYDALKKFEDDGWYDDPNLPVKRPKVLGKRAD